MKGRFWIAAGALFAGTAVAAGAIGTHVLEETLKLPERELKTFDVAVRYQMFHALGMIAVGLLAARWRSRLIAIAGCTFVLGIVLFSGGIYAWLATGQTPFIHVVPIGGSAWIIGWLLLSLGMVWAAPADERDYRR